MFTRVPFRQKSLQPGLITGPFRPVSLGLATKTVISNNLAVLSRIYEDDVNLCLIQRSIPQDIEAFVFSALQGRVNIETAKTIDPNRFDFSSLWPQMQHMTGYQVWLDDVAMLCQAYCELFGRAETGLRLNTLDKAMCPRFHVDRVPCRLICSYGGIGTEWLPEYAVDRSKLGLGSKGLSDSESGLIVDDTAIRSMPAYAVGLMKGENWEGNENRGLVHRSPTPTTLQSRRLLLTLDML